MSTRTNTVRPHLGRNTPKTRRLSVRPSVEPLEDRNLLAAYHDLIGVTAIRNDASLRDIDGTGVTVAIIDTGIDYSHSLIRDAVVTDVNGQKVGFDPINGDGDPNDENGHGTHVAGLVAARDPNIGIATDARVIGLKVGGAGSQVDTQAIQRSLQWVIDNKDRYNILVVNMSLGGGFYRDDSNVASHPYYDLVQRLQQMGVTVVSSAGNDYYTVSENQNSPQLGGYLKWSGAPGVFSTLDVGAVWQDGSVANASWRSGAQDLSTGADRITSFSERPDTAGQIFAPGAILTSLRPGDRTQGMAGTSQAAPVVSGVVALMQEAAAKYGNGRYLTPAEVRDIMTSTAHVINDGDDERDNVTNTGSNYLRVDAYAAVQEVRRRMEGSTQPPPANSPDPNGTLAAPYVVQQLTDGVPTAIAGTIGTDAGTIQVGNKDVDLFRFEVPTGGRLVTLETFSRTTNLVDTYLRLFDANGNEITTNDDKPNPGQGQALYSQIIRFLAAGTYYAGVSGYDNGNYDPATAGSGVAADTGDYTFTITATSPDPNGILEGAKSVIVTQEGPTLQYGNIGRDNFSLDASYNPVGGTVVGDTDVDLFRMRVPDNGTLTVWTDSRFQDDAPLQSQYADTVLHAWLINADGSLTFLGANDDRTDVSNAPGAGRNSDSVIQLAGVERGQEVLIGVSSYNNIGYDPTSLDGRSNTSSFGHRQGYYSLMIDFVNPDPDGVIGTTRGQTSLTATQVGTTAVTLSGKSIGFDGSTHTGPLDVDFYRFTPTQTGVLEIVVNSTQGTSYTQTVDTVLQAWDVQGNRLAFNDDTNGLDPVIRIPVQAGNDYFFSVSGFPNVGFDPFRSASGSPSSKEGQYDLVARVLPGGNNAVRDVNDNSRNNGTPRSIRVGENISGEIGADNGFVPQNGGSSDVDMYQFQATRTGQVDIVVRPDLEFGADAVLRFFDATGRELSRSFESGPTGNILRVNATAGQTYYIGVSGYSETAGNYDPNTGGLAGGGTFFSSAGQGGYLLSLEDVPERPAAPPAYVPPTPVATVFQGHAKKKGKGRHGKRKGHGRKLLHR